MEKRIWKSVPVVGCEALLLVTAMLAWAGLGCSTSGPGPVTKYANVNDPINGEKIQPASVQPGLIRQFKGANVAFSNEAAAQQWDKLSDQEKQQKLNKVLTAPSAGPGCAPGGGRTGGG